MTKRIAAVAAGCLLCCAVAASATSRDHTPTAAVPLVSSPTPRETAFPSSLEQVKDMQEQVGAYGADLRQAAGGAVPNPNTVRIGPVPCPGRYTDFAPDGAFYVSGGWQLDLAPDRQIATLRAIRDRWLAKGFRVEYREFDDNTRASVQMEDPGTGFELSVASTLPPTAVAIRVLSVCVHSVDGKFPGDSLTIYQ